MLLFDKLTVRLEVELLLRSTSYIYGLTPFARHLISDVREKSLLS